MDFAPSRRDVILKLVKLNFKCDTASHQDRDCCDQFEVRQSSNMFLCCRDVYLKLAPWRPRMSTPRTNFIQDAGGALGHADISMILRAETLLDGATSSSGVSRLSGWTQRKYATEPYKPGWPTTGSWPEDRNHSI